MAEPKRDSERTSSDEVPATDERDRRPSGHGAGSASGRGRTRTGISVSAACKYGTLGLAVAVAVLIGITCRGSTSVTVSPTPTPTPTLAPISMSIPDLLTYSPPTPVISALAQTRAPVTFYVCSGAPQLYEDGFCGYTASGSLVYAGGAACGYAHDLWERFRIEGDPTNRTYDCIDRGWLHPEQADIFFPTYQEGRAWRDQLPLYPAILWEKP